MSENHLFDDHNTRHAKPTTSQPYGFSAQDRDALAEQMREAQDLGQVRTEDQQPLNVVPGNGEEAVVTFGLSRRMITVLIIGLLLIGAVATFIGIRLRAEQQAGSNLRGLEAGSFSLEDIINFDLPALDAALVEALNDGAKVLEIGAQLKVNNEFVLKPSEEPPTPEFGQIYIGASDQNIYYYDGDQFVQLNGAGDVTVNNITTTQNSFQTGVTSLTGTADQVLVSSSTGDVTLSLPQSIGAGSTPTFGGLTIDGASTFNDLITINADLVPGTNSTYDLGAPTLRFQNIYADNIFGSITPSGFTEGSVIFADASGSLSQDNPNFFWDDANNRQHIGPRAANTVASMELTSPLNVYGAPYVGPASGINTVGGAATLQYGLDAGTTTFGFEDWTLDKPILTLRTPNAVVKPASGINTALLIEADTWSRGTGNGISIDFGAGDRKSRIIHYGDVSASLGSRLQLQTHTTSATTWNGGIKIWENGAVTVGTNLDPVTATDVALGGLTVYGAASQKTAVFRANATSPSEVLEAQNSTGASLLTLTALGRLSIISDTTLNRFRVEAYGGAGANGVPDIWLKSQRGTRTSPEATQSGDVIGQLSFLGYDGGGAGNQAIGAFIRADASAEWNTAGDVSDAPADLLFFTSPDGSDVSIERVRIQSNGNVGIGDTTPDYKLDVVGTGAFESNSTTAFEILPVGSSPGTGFFRIDNAGAGQAVFGTHSGATPLGTLQVDATCTTCPILVISHNAGKTGDMTQWIEDGGSVVAVVDVDGKFGIGDTTPAALFTVGNGDLFQITDSGDITANLSAGNNISAVATSAPVSDMLTLSNNGFETTTNNADAFQITWKTAEVAGSVNNAGIRINVNGVGATEAGDQLFGIDIDNTSGNPTGTAVGIQIQDGFDSSISSSATSDLSLTAGTTGDIVFQLDSDTPALFSGGNVGIGDTSPAALLTVGSGDLFQVNSSGTLTFSGVSTDITTGTNEDLTLDPNGSGSLVVVGLDCSGNTNGGALTANAMGFISCSDDDSGGGGGGTLQQAYDASGTPATITTSSGTKTLLFKAGGGFDSTSLFQVQNSGGSPILSVDTTNSRVDVTALASSGDLSVNGNTTLGNASGDAVTINGNTVSIPNSVNFDTNTFVIDASTDRIGIGTNAPSNKLSVVLDDGNTGTVATVARILHTTTGTAVNGIGAYVSIGAETSGGTATTATRLGGVLTDVSGSGSGAFVVDTLLSGSFNERFRVDSAGTITFGGTLGTADNVNYLCRNSSNQIATCSGAATGAAFVQNGNSFGGVATLGTNDANNLAFETSGTTKWVIETDGDFVPQSDDDYDIGDATHRVQDIYAGPGTIHIGTAASDEYKLGYDTANNTLEIQAAVDAVEGFQILDTDGGTPILNVDTTNERVGVGTASPAYLLTVQPSADNSGHLVVKQADGGDAIALGTFSGGDGFARVKDTSEATKVELNSNGTSYITGGNLGIGTTTAGSRLLVQPSTTNSDGIYINSVTSGWSAFGLQLDSTSKGFFAVSRVADDVATGATNGDIVLRTQGGDLLFNTNSGGASAAIINGSGNLGIGDMTPAAMLTVGSGDLFQVSSAGIVTYVDGTTNTDTLVCRNSSGQLAACSNATLGGNAFIQNGNSFGALATLGTNDSNNLAFETNNVEQGRFTTSGELLLGTTTTFDSGVRLQVQGAASEKTAIFRANATSPGNILELQSSTPTTVFSVSATGLTTMAALGTADNVNYLCRNSSNQIATCSGTATGAAFIQNGNSFGGVATLGTNDNFNLGFETNGTSRWVIETDGDFVPQSDDDYDIGDATHRVQDIYAGPGTIHVGTSAADEYTIGYNTTSNYLGFNVNGSGNEEVVFDSSGNVGIGTTAPASIGDGGSPKILQVHNTGANAIGSLLLTTDQTAQGTAIGSINFGSTGSSTTKRSAEIVSYLEASGTTNATGNLVFHTNNAGNFDERMRISSSGNVGIGDAGPTEARLSVVGAPTNAGVYTLAVDGDSTQATGSIIVANVVGSQSVASSGAFTGLTVTNDYTAASGSTLANLIGVYGTPQNSSTGNISNVYGVVGDPVNASTGTIDQAYGLLGRVRNTTTGTITNAYGLLIADPGNSGGGTISNKYAIVTGASAGNVGIGTTTPTARLQVQDTTPELRITATTSNTAGQLAFYENTSVAWIIDAERAGGFLQFSSYNGGSTTPRVTFLDSGNVGIGTTTPTLAKLQVAAGNVLLDNNQNLQFKDGGGTPRSLVGMDASDMQYFGTVNNNASIQGYTLNLSTVRPAGNGADSIYDITSTVDLGASDEFLQLGDSAATFMTILGNGNVGIGTTSPDEILEVSGSTTTTNTVLVSNSSTAGPTLKLASSDTGGRTYSMISTASGNSPGAGFLGFADTTGAVAYRMVIDSSGNVGVGTIAPGSRVQITGGGLCVGSDANCNTDNNTEGVIYSSSTAMTVYDVAENYPTKDDTLEPGEIVTLDTGRGIFVKRSGVANDSMVIGAISEEPGVLLGGFNGKQFEDEHQVAVALSGRILVKVSTENGPVKVGDPITTSSTPGVGMKATAAGRVIGIALQDLDSGTDKVMVFVNPHYWQPTPEQVATENEETMWTRLETGTDRLWGIVSTKLESLGVAISENWLRVKNFAAETFTVGSSEQPAGITIYDKTTKEPYCIEVDQGEFIKTPGVCPIAETP